MVKVYLSHMGNPILKGVKEYEANEGDVLSVINELNSQYSGIKGHILNDNNNILSKARLFKNVLVHESEFGGYNYYESDKVKEIKDVKSDMINDKENLLISLFEPLFLKDILNESLSDLTDTFNYKNLNGEGKTKEYKPVISEIPEEYMIKEDIKAFKAGETTLESLTIGKNENPVIKFIGSKVDTTFDKSKSKLLPSNLVNAIRNIWEISQDEEGRLRLFQEDCLFFIMSKLLEYEYPAENQLLLSMPTGGGKTEAFFIPIVSKIFLDKNRMNQNISSGIKTIIIYPTNALALDQAKRFVDLINQLNNELREEFLPNSKYITIGILSGDTPRENNKLEKKSLIQICPNCGNSHFERDGNTLICKAVANGQICNTTLDFCRLTKDDIVQNPPDILITNPDEINFALHSPKYAKLFYENIETIVFDEVHMYQGIFGCHISHLLRRIEEISNNKPLYIGLSATIGNAKELASLLFNEKLDNIKYNNNINDEYTTDKSEKYRHHLLIRPAIINKNT
ncbi:MAG: DEAD/DEAH box helicase, partial [bacterium]